MAEQMNTLTIAEIQSELQRMNDALRQVVEGYETLNQRFQEYVLSEPDLAHRNEEAWWGQEPDAAPKKAEEPPLQEETLSKEQGTDTAERLASDLDAFAQAYDPYEYADSFEAGSMDQIESLLADGDPKGITDWLKEILEEEPDNREAQELLVRVEALCPPLSEQEQGKSESEEISEEPKRPEKMACLLVRPGGYPERVEIGTSLEDLQGAVGGMIEAVYPFEDEVAIVCNEEGKINGMEMNRALYADDGSIYDVIAGDFLIVGLTEEDFGPLSQKLMDKYENLFHDPEQFMSIDGRIVAFPGDVNSKEIPEEEEKIEVSFGRGEPSFGKKTVFMAAAVMDKNCLEQELYAQCFINPDDPKQDYDYLKEVITEQAMARAGVGADRLVFGEFTDFVRAENEPEKDQSGEAEPHFTEKTEAVYPAKENGLPFDVEIHSLSFDGEQQKSEPSSESESPEHEKPR